MASICDKFACKFDKEKLLVYAGRGDNKLRVYFLIVKFLTVDGCAHACVIGSATIAKR